MRFDLWSICADWLLGFLLPLPARIHQVQNRGGECEVTVKCRRSSATGSSEGFWLTFATVRKTILSPRPYFDENESANFTVKPDSSLSRIFFSNSQYFRETILNEIRKARELYTGMELAAELSRIQQRLDNVECLSVDIVINLLLTYRDIQVRLLGGISLNISTLSFVKLSVLPRDN